MFRDKLTSNLKPVDIIDSDLLTDTNFDRNDRGSIQVSYLETFYLLRVQYGMVRIQYGGGVGWGGVG